MLARDARSVARRVLSPIYDNRRWLKDALVKADITVDLVRHSAASVFPQLIRPDPRQLFISLTASCNNRCKGCHYGRDFMPGHQLSLRVVKDLLDDAQAARFERVRLYGGEPLLHKELPRIIEHCARLRLGMWVTTNGVLLRSRIDDLVAAGLRHVSVGLYGIGGAYDDYVQRPGRFASLERGLAYVRDRYGMDVGMHLDWLLMRPTCNPSSLHGTLRLAERYAMPICVNLVHYSLPYFTGPEQRELQFTPDDRPAVEAAVAELLRFKEARPDLVLVSTTGLRAIPDWLIQGPAMRIPCTSYRLIWVGADGTVQMCYVKFKLGNLNEKRLSEMLFTAEHRKAARDAFSLNCPNCHCGYDTRTLRHAPARSLYGRATDPAFAGNGDGVAGRAPLTAG